MTASALPFPARRRSRRLLLPMSVLGVVLLGTLATAWLQLRASPALPVLGQLPPFELTDQTGGSFGSKDLEGTVWVAGFIFTRCPTICPAVTATMTRMQPPVAAGVPPFKLVSFSVDPEHDTPSRLLAYATRHEVGVDRWRFLTGPLDAIKATVTDGLKVAMEAPEGDQDFASVFHGTHFVLVDQASRIRGYYDSRAPDVVERVVQDATLLAKGGR